MIETIKTLCRLPGPSGWEDAVRDWIAAEAAPYADQMITDAQGSLLGFKKGRSTPKEPVLLAAHMDEVGVVIREIDDEGYLRFGFLGGVDRRVVIGKRVSKERLLEDVLCRRPLPHAHQADAPHGVAVGVHHVFDVGVGPHQAALVTHGRVCYARPRPCPNCPPLPCPWPAPYPMPPPAPRPWLAPLPVPRPCPMPALSQTPLPSSSTKPMPVPAPRVPSTFRPSALPHRQPSANAGPRHWPTCWQKDVAHLCAQQTTPVAGVACVPASVAPALPATPAVSRVAASADATTRARARLLLGA